MMHAGEEAHSEEAMAQGVAPEKAEGDEDYTNLQRVKVYRLNEGGHWDDKGTGHVSCVGRPRGCSYVAGRGRGPELEASIY